ncbi:MAG: 2-oxoacid:acceptor oxidoreductase family protein [Candidatus Margulisiibacteriota bacterium]
MPNQEFSILIGGRAGYGIDKAGTVISRILNQLGYRQYIYRDYPSLIRGGHTFSIIRASAKDKIYSHENKVDYILALNQETIDLHRDKLKKDGTILSDPDLMKEEGREITGNSLLIGSFCRTMGIGWAILEEVFRRSFPRELEQNLKVARQGYDRAQEKVKLEPLKRELLPLLTGNEALGLGLIQGGLNSYVAYPMTPSSAILHFLAAHAQEFSLKVIQPESEIAVMLMALGMSYAGERAAVGTSGGGFCLMTEGLSFSGQAELPIVIVLGQRTGPSTGLPTYTGQTELHFALNAGQGEFPRLILAPGDAEEAYYCAALALNLAYKHKVPAIIMTDKTVAEGTYNFDLKAIPQIAEEKPAGIVAKINSYEHDKNGITTEEAAITQSNAEARLQKGKDLLIDIEKLETVKVYGRKDAPTALLCWGSNKGVCLEVGEKLGMKVIQSLVLSPFPVEQVKAALSGVNKLISVENNSTGQLERLLNQHGFKVDERILKYDGRPFSLDELEAGLR